MPFDGTNALQSEDLVKLRVALEGVRGRGWSNHAIGARRPEAPHCALGWLLVATDWDRDETTRLALDYVYPALPESARREGNRMRAISDYNDRGSRERVVGLFTKAVELAEEKVLAVR